MMKLNKLFEEAGRIASFRKLLPFFIVSIIVCGVLILHRIIYSIMPNKEFYVVELNGSVQDIFHESKDNYFLIDSVWYLIKDECIAYISKGDSICKKENSYLFKVYDKQSNIKWHREIKNLIFKQVDAIGE